MFLDGLNGVVHLLSRLAHSEAAYGVTGQIELRYACLLYTSLSCCSRIFAKHSLQYMGRSDLGSKGTFASQPHMAQTAVKNSRGPRAAFLRASRQGLQRWGSFWKPRSA